MLPLYSDNASAAQSTIARYKTPKVAIERVLTFSTHLMGGAFFRADVIFGGHCGPLLGDALPIFNSAANLERSLEHISTKDTAWELPQPRLFEVAKEVLDPPWWNEKHLPYIDIPFSARLQMNTQLDLMQPSVRHTNLIGLKESERSTYCTNHADNVLRLMSSLRDSLDLPESVDARQLANIQPARSVVSCALHISAQTLSSNDEKPLSWPELGLRVYPLSGIDTTPWTPILLSNLHIMILHPLFTLTEEGKEDASDLDRRILQLASTLCAAEPEEIMTKMQDCEVQQKYWPRVPPSDADNDESQRLSAYKPAAPIFFSEVTRGFAKGMKEILPLLPAFEGEGMAGIPCHDFIPTPQKIVNCRSMVCEVMENVCINMTSSPCLPSLDLPQISDLLHTATRRIQNNEDDLSHLLEEMPDLWTISSIRHRYLPEFQIHHESVEVGQNDISDNEDKPKPQSKLSAENTNDAAKCFPVKELAEAVRVILPPLLSSATVPVVSPVTRSGLASEINTGIEHNALNCEGQPSLLELFRQIQEDVLNPEGSKTALHTVSSSDREQTDSFSMPVDEPLIWREERPWPPQHEALLPERDIVEGEGTKSPVAVAADGHLPAFGLQVLVSEAQFEASPWLVTELARNHNIHCVDARLEEPLALIVDGHTAVLLLAAEKASDRSELKRMVKAMTTVAFKFRVLWLLIVSVSGKKQKVIGQTGFYSGLSQSLSQFPCRTVLRQCSSETLSDQVATICADAQEEASVAFGLSPQAYRLRPIFAGLARGQALASGAVCMPSRGSPQPFILPQHCQFLQLLPTINFYVAAELLLYRPLHRLLCMQAETLLSQAALQLPNRAALCDMIALLRRHIGMRYCPADNPPKVKPSHSADSATICQEPVAISPPPPISPTAAAWARNGARHSPKPIVKSGVPGGRPLRYTRPSDGKSKGQTILQFY